MALMEGKLTPLNGIGFERTVRKTVLSVQGQWPGFVPTHVSVALEEAQSYPETVGVLLTNKKEVELTVYGCKTTRPGHVFVCRPVKEK